MITAVIDTNVLYSALRSNRGASFKLLRLLGTGRFDILLSVPLLFEYEDVLKRGSLKGLSGSDVDDVLNYICKIAQKREIFFLWRPLLKDPKDDMILELAFESSADYIITHNVTDFAHSSELGIRAITPREFLSILGELT